MTWLSVRGSVTIKSLGSKYFCVIWFVSVPWDVCTRERAYKVMSLSLLIFFLSVPLYSFFLSLIQFRAGVSLEFLVQVASGALATNPGSGLKIQSPPSCKKPKALPLGPAWRPSSGQGIRPGVLAWQRKSKQART